MYHNHRYYIIVVHAQVFTTFTREKQDGEQHSMTWPVLEALQSSIQLAMLSLFGRHGFTCHICSSLFRPKHLYKHETVRIMYATHFELVVPSLNFNCVDGSWAVMIEVIPQVEVSFHPDLRHINLIKAHYWSGIVVVVI